MDEVLCPISNKLLYAQASNFVSSSTCLHSLCFTVQEKMYKEIIFDVKTKDLGSKDEKHDNL